MVSSGAIIAGICIIGILYFIPITSIQVPSFLGSQSYSVSYTISSISSLCDNSLISALGGSTCQTYKGLFYIGWISGIILIVYGLTKK